MDLLYTLTAAFAEINFAVLIAALFVLVKHNDNINERIKEGFKETNETFIKVSNSLERIDDAQRHIASLNREVVSLQEILGDKKAHGYYGEIQLNALLYSIFGENSDIYEIGYQLGNTKVDVLLKLPEPLGNIGVDSKCPLENYKKMIDKSFSKNESDEASEAFKDDINKHINDISGKYIIPNETNSHAIMFIPAESIFSYIHAYIPEIVEFADESNIWIVSPTTFMALLTTVQVVLRNLKKDEYAQEIYKELNFLGDNFKQYGERRAEYSRNIETVYKDIKDAAITSDKIKKRVDADISDPKSSGKKNNGDSSNDIDYILDRIDDAENINITENIQNPEKLKNKKEKDGDTVKDTADKEDGVNVDDIYKRR